MIALTVVGLELGPKKPEESEKSPYLNKEYKHPKGEISFPAELTPAVTNVTCRLCVATTPVSKQDQLFEHRLSFSPLPMSFFHH